MDQCPYNDWPQRLHNGWVILRNEQDWRAWVDHGRPPKFGSTELLYGEAGSFANATNERLIEVTDENYRFRPPDGRTRKIRRSKPVAIIVQLLTHPGRPYTYAELDTIWDDAEAGHAKRRRDDGGAASDQQGIDAAARDVAAAMDAGTESWRQLRDAPIDTLCELKAAQLANDDPAENNTEAAGLIQRLIDLRSATTTTTTTPTKRLAQRVRHNICRARQILGPEWYRQHGIVIQNHAASQTQQVPGAYSYNGPRWIIA